VLSPTAPHMTHSSSSPAATNAAASSAAAGPSTPSSPGCSSSPGGLTAFGSRSSFDLAQRSPHDLTSKNSVGLAHRFRNSLDLELMRHASSQDLAHSGTAGALALL
jgi:hypothetical protein